MKSLAAIKDNLAFTCKHETLPSASADSDVLFKYARWLEKNNQLKQNPDIDLEIARLYRIATENGHPKANINLQNGGLRGKYKLRGHEHLRFSQDLIDANVATGYYFVSVFLKNGIADLKQDMEMSLRYLRKAADEGSAQAQYEIGDALAPSSRAPDVARQMRRCAAEQGHGAAANILGVYLQDNGAHADALEAFQLGVAAGDESSSSFLQNGFRGPEPTDELYYLGLEEDLERAERYKTIWRILARYSYAHPKVPEINDILPLPPARLPPWDGKLQWLEALEANVPPEKPSPELIQRLTQDLKLDPATGRPMPGAKGFSQAHLSADQCVAGSKCPVSGWWQVVEHWELHTADGQSIVRHFEQGDVFPVERMRYYRDRIWPLPKSQHEGPVRVWWRLA
ncbi:SEL1-like repeat protein [Pseudomonas sp.]|uniref:SEL1-like repeat protein n=1 Tax=Pseudomonas sp. TaxID=306 RepID=UPI002ED9F85B